MTITGPQSGRLLTFLVRYVRRGDDLFVLSPTIHQWWRNLEGGAPVTLLLRGGLIEGFAEVLPRRPGTADRIDVRVSGLFLPPVVEAHQTGP